MKIDNYPSDITETLNVVKQSAFSVDDLFMLEKHLVAEGRNSELPIIYQTWIDNHASSPSLALAYFNYACLDLTNFARAEVLLHKALELYPKFFQAHINLGNCLKRQNRVDEAMVYWRAALQNPAIRLPKNKAVQITALNNLGQALQNNFDYHEASVFFNASLALDQNQKDLKDLVSSLVLGRQMMRYVKAAIMLR